MIKLRGMLNPLRQAASSEQRGRQGLGRVAGARGECTLPRQPFRAAVQPRLGAPAHEWGNNAPGPGELLAEFCSTHGASSAPACPEPSCSELFCQSLMGEACASQPCHS